MQDDVIEFLEQSNFIEGVRDGLDDSVKAWKYIIKKKKLTKPFILHAHGLLMKNQQIEAHDKGNWRKQQVWIGGREGKPWYVINELMDSWIIAMNRSLKDKFVDTEERKQGTAVALHIAFEDIHPFIDGNGRMGRILMNWQLQNMGLPIKVIREEHKQEYYKWFSRELPKPVDFNLIEKLITR